MDYNRRIHGYPDIQVIYWAGVGLNLKSNPIHPFRALSAGDDDDAVEVQPAKRRQIESNSTKKAPKKASSPTIIGDSDEPDHQDSTQNQEQKKTKAGTGLRRPQEWPVDMST